MQGRAERQQPDSYGADRTEFSSARWRPRDARDCRWRGRSRATAALAGAPVAEVLRRGRSRPGPRDAEAKDTAADARPVYQADDAQPRPGATVGPAATYIGKPP